MSQAAGIASRSAHGARRVPSDLPTIIIGDSRPVMRLEAERVQWAWLSSSSRLPGGSSHSSATTAQPASVRAVAGQNSSGMEAV